MFNIQGSELIFLLLVALVILGPEKLPEAVRKFTKAYSEFRKMANGFQGELKQVLDEPMRELRETADAVREATKFDLDPEVTGSLKNLMGGSSAGSKPATARMQPASSDITPKAATPRTDGGLNFGKPAARRQASGDTPVADEAADTTAADTTAADTTAAEAAEAVAAEAVEHAVDSLDGAGTTVAEDSTE